MWFGLVSWGSNHGAFKSPPVLKEYSFCYLTFYYILSDSYGYRNHISLTVFIEDNSGKKITALWHAEESVYNWKKKVLKLPTTLSSYSVVFLGYYYRDWNPPYVLIDDIKFWQCNSCKFLCLFVAFFLFSYTLFQTKLTQQLTLVCFYSPTKV